MIRTATLVLAALLAAGAAEAQRPFTPRLSCAQAQALVASRGQVVMSTSPTTYDRFVASAQFCDRTDYLEGAAVPTLDVPACPVGYRCVDRSRYDFD
jgi:hypothetical protein